jgi:hypothetical protein
MTQTLLFLLQIFSFFPVVKKTRLCDLNQQVRSCTCALSQSMSSFSTSGLPRFWMHIRLCCIPCERLSWKMVCPNTWLQLDFGTHPSWLMLLSDTETGRLKLAVQVNNRLILLWTNGCSTGWNWLLSVLPHKA